jgi:hypothetical protein
MLDSLNHSKANDPLMDSKYQITTIGERISTKNDIYAK